MTAELRANVKQHVAPYKSPRHVSPVDELPKAPTGKSLKRATDRPSSREGWLRCVYLPLRHACAARSERKSRPSGGDCW